MLGKPCSYRIGVCNLLTAQEIKPHCLEIAREASNKQALPRILRVHLHRTVLRPTETQSIAQKHKCLGQRLGIRFAFGCQRCQPDRAIELRDADQLGDQFGRRATGGQLLTIGFGLRLDIGRLSGGPGRAELVTGAGAGTLPDVRVFQLGAGGGLERVRLRVLETP